MIFNWTPRVEDEEIETVETIKAAIERRKAIIERVEEFLPYADGGAYYQDKEKIRGLSKELEILYQHLQEKE